MTKLRAKDIYPITTITYPDGNVTEGISFDHLKQYPAPIKYDQLMEWLIGQTMGEAGVYVHDIDIWLNGGQNND